jgi:hypothetical protein
VAGVEVLQAVADKQGEQLQQAVQREPERGGAEPAGGNDQAAAEVGVEFAVGGDFDKEVDQVTQQGARSSK